MISKIGSNYTEHEMVHRYNDKDGNILVVGIVDDKVVSFTMIINKEE